MKPSLVEIILVALHVLSAFYVVSSASDLAKDDSSENGQKYSNNKDDMAISITSWNTLAKHSISQMWISKTCECVQCPSGHNNVTILSLVQIFNNGPLQSKNESIRLLRRSNQMQSKKNIYVKTLAMNTFPHISEISPLSYVSISKALSHRPNKKKCHKKKRGGLRITRDLRMISDCVYDGLDLK
ncbi:hypothetical protein RFI_22577 [Reticulomyxa filosa]|uniref:Uncharacterized protein n=1 Tax=Reticulomyxa filosa TaxID=46433 RepID=X6MMC0_RETFI|nr:hypothetical protein RFI_22577 [Reticulomyxa filosa]|eukprot:ETO14791.1 hypothetical protein RFI_22577 [Reticulomyxa filosa]